MRFHSLRRKVLWAVGCVAGLTCGHSAVAATPPPAGPSFEVIDTSQLTSPGLPALSGDGSTLAVTDRYLNAAGTESYLDTYRWRRESGLQKLDLPTTANISGISTDGMTLVGMRYDWRTPETNYAIRWTEAAGMESLGKLSGDDSQGAHAYAVSADGTVVIGTGFYGVGGGGLRDEAFRWTPSTGMTRLVPRPHNTPALNNGTRSASADGSAIAGVADEFGVFRWTEELGTQWVLPNLTSTDTYPLISGNGEVILTSSGSKVHRWSQSGGVQEWTPPASFSLRDLNWDGSLAVGELTKYATPGQPPSYSSVLLDSTGAFHSLTDYLSVRGVELPDWDRFAPIGISDDGHTFVGVGFDAAGQRHLWIATVPEPSGLLVIVGAASLLARRRRSRAVATVTIEQNQITAFHQ